jgi:EAL domain-containing protein (putative c-di-GMP-specific phosphodiesterase class I)
VVGFEALLRWQKAGRLVPPADFISQLEGSDAMTSVGEWVLNTACAQLTTWRSEGRELRACVNVSARQFDDGSILPSVTRALIRHQIPPSALELEITETLLMRNAGATRVALEGLRGLGVRLAVDDFGTGYSSLAYLGQLPVDVLKIDRSFVARSSDNESCATITSVVIGLGRRLGLQVVAEGVETLEQLAFLEREGCELAQGYLLGAPSPTPSLIFPRDLDQAARDAVALRDSLACCDA